MKLDGDVGKWPEFDRMMQILVSVSKDEREDWLGELRLEFMDGDASKVAKDNAETVLGRLRDHLDGIASWDPRYHELWDLLKRLCTRSE